MQVPNLLSLSTSEAYQNSHAFFKNAETTGINFDRVHELLVQLKPLSLPFTDFNGKIIQLWKINQTEFLGAVLDQQGNFTIVPGKKIHTP
jgi:hypothetical protein